MEIYKIILIVAVIVILVIVSYLIKFKYNRKKWIFKKDVETPTKEQSTFLVEGSEREFKSEKEAEDFINSQR